MADGAAVRDGLIVEIRDGGRTDVNKGRLRCTWIEGAGNGGLKHEEGGGEGCGDGVVVG